MTTKLNFEVESAEIIGDSTADSQFATARIRAFHTGKSLHDTWCDFDVLQRTAPTLYEKPIIFELDTKFGDFGTHNEGVTVPAGFVVPNSAEYELREDGRTALTVMAKIWKKYSGSFLEIFQDTNKTKKSVSVEMELYDYEKSSDGLLRLIDFAYSAICVLGDYITPASPGSELEMLSFAKEQTEQYEEAFAKEFASRYDDIDFTIPASIKRNAKKALEKYNKEEGISTVLLANARFMTNSATITPERVRTLFKRFQKNNLDELTMGMLGGKTAYRWLKELVAQMDEADEQEIRYFSGEESIAMPYSSLSEINPALKGIDPPITLAQANSIARQADGIGADKGGWGIAIKRFKDAHTVKEGKWVKKQNMSLDEEEENKSMTTQENPNGQEQEVLEQEGIETPETPEVETPVLEDPAPPAESEEEIEEAPETEEPKELVFSYADYFSQEELMSFFAEEETDDDDTKAKFSAAKAEFEVGKNAGIMMAAMFAALKKMQAKVSQMAKDAEVYMSENEELKKFKAEVDAQQKQYAVQQTLDELKEKADLPENVIEEIIAEASKYSLAELDTWKNFAKAKSFDFAKKDKPESEEDDITRFGLPFYRDVSPQNDLWAS